LKSSQLRIEWAMPQPPVMPENWQIWGDLTRAVLDDDALESTLHWPPQTVATIRKALAEQLGRATGWESTSPAVAMAARVFKRGVGYRRPGATFAPTSLTGSYQLSISNERMPPLHQIVPGSFVIVDGNVARHYPRLAETAGSYVLTLDEQTKTLASVAQIIEQSRHTKSGVPWTIIGGGLLTDVAAFAGALCGADLYFFPTTLLAMADACVGGKTGVNFPPFGKNQVGLFKFPQAVHIWTGWLDTLPAREIVAGGAECIKHAYLAGDLTLARGLADALAAQNLSALAALLPTVIGFKAKIVAADPGETGQRAILNFGHTLAHALEGISQSRTTGETTLLHGEAVGLGMIFALILSRRVASLPPQSADVMLGILRQAGCSMSQATLQRRLGEADLHSPKLLTEMSRLIGHDKKNVTPGEKSSQWVLLSAPGAISRQGSSSWTVAVSDTELPQVWHEFLQSLT